MKYGFGVPPGFGTRAREPTQCVSVNECPRSIANDNVNGLIVDPVDRAACVARLKSPVLYERTVLPLTFLLTRVVNALMSPLRGSIATTAASGSLLSGSTFLTALTTARCKS